MKNTMKAIVYTKFGPPEVLYLKEVEKPAPRNNEVLIKIFATSVVKEDPDMRAAPGFNGLFKPAHQILGEEFSGVIEAVGRNVTLFKSGDPVYGINMFGSYAEYLCMPETGALAIKPANLSYEEAAVIPNGALTALPYLRDKGNIKNGQSVLVFGASGSVGSAAVQLARHFGARVTAVCSTTNLEWVSALGADEVIDYTRTDFTKNGQTYDIIFDTVAKWSFSRVKGSLTDNGIYLSTGPSLEILFQSIRPAERAGKKARMAAAGLRPARAKAKDLIYLTGLIEAGYFKPVIDKTYSLEEMAESHRYVEQGHKKGNVAILVSRIDSNNQ
jgi:NADPH:quinone reductase-like Zn-dependent oxidoreductase